jgi:hypothetical protein
MPEGGSLTPIIAVSAQGFSITHKPVESFDYKCRIMRVIQKSIEFRNPMTLSL